MDEGVKSSTELVWEKEGRKETIFLIWSKAISHIQYHTLQKNGIVALFVLGYGALRAITQNEVDILQYNSGPPDKVVTCTVFNYKFVLVVCVAASQFCVFYYSSTGTAAYVKLSVPHQAKSILLFVLLYNITVLCTHYA